MTDQATRVKTALGEAALDALVLLKPMNSYYASGFTSLDSAHPTSFTRPIATIATPDRLTLIVPRLDEEPARAMAWADEVVSYSGTPAFEAAYRAIADALAGMDSARMRIGIEEDYLNVQAHRFLSAALPQATFADASSLLNHLRIKKTDRELETLRASAGLSEAALAASVAAAQPGATELEVQAAGVDALVGDGANGAADGVVESLPMILSGPHSSMPHDFTTRRRLERGDVMWHCWLVAYDGYWVENIRTTVVGGKPSDEQRRIYDAVREAHDRGMAAVRPGNTPADAYEAVRSTLARHDLEDGFILRRSGHGMGLEYHEPPFVEPSDLTVLEPGMILTIEPGVFYSGMGGITLSDTLLVTEAGHEVLTTSSRDLV
jgi:Xaa-Pro dipeptidase